MKSIFYALLSTLLLHYNLTAQTTNWNWVRTIPQNNNDGNAITRDRWGNLYVVGTFASQTITFGDSTFAINGYSDVFLAKYDSLGNVLWAHTAGGPGYDKGLAVATDSVGNVYIAGNFGESPMILDTAQLFRDNSGDNVFLAKYDSGGMIQWVRSSSGVGINRTNCMAADAAGNVYLAGIYAGISTQFGNTTLFPAEANGGMFLVKYTTTGDVKWATAANGVTFDKAQGVAADDSGNVFLTGTFQSHKLAFMNGDTLLNLTVAGGFDIFLARFDTSGHVAWAKAVDRAAGEGIGICMGKPGEIYISGFCAGDTMRMDTVVLTGLGAHDAFIAKFNSSGAALWAKHGKGSLFDYGKSVSADKQGHVYLTGYFASPTVEWGTTSVNKNGTGSSTNTDMIVVAYSDTGKLEWVLTAGNSSRDELYGVAAGDNGEVFVTGFAGSTSFNAGSIPVTSTGHDIFIAKIGPVATGITEALTGETLKIYPNPSTGNFAVVLPENVMQIEIIDVMGRVLQTIQPSQSFMSLSIKQEGMFLIKTTTRTNTIIQRLIVCR